jgi:stage II sporulation protein D
MKFWNSLFLPIIYLIANPLFAQKIDIGILNDRNPKKLLIEASSGKYKIKSGNKTIYRLKNDRSIILNSVNGFINASNARKDFGLFTELNITSKKYKFANSHEQLNSKKNNELTLKMIDPKLEARIYQGNIDFRIFEKNLLIVNQVGLSDYLSGVVETESGPKAEEEYYKNQAVICRTYALKSPDKHKTQGFNLCDGVHCQAYKGKSTSNPLIQTTVNSTKDLVVVDENNELISSLFSANCGGQTCNSEDVWTSKLNYLRSIQDQFCIDQKQATWTKTIDKQEFINFLNEKSLIIPDTFNTDSLAFEQPIRKVNYTVNNQEIKLTIIRSGLNLRSTFFSIKPEGEQLIFAGRGYGHGVGMCQEGAMNMAKKGYKFDEIIKYYYTNVKIIKVNKLKNKPPYYN